MSELAERQHTFIFEVCENCSINCKWNTRHDEAKYKSFFEKFKAMIQAELPNAVCVMNHVPKQWKH